MMVHRRTSPAPALPPLFLAAALLAPLSGCGADAPSGPPPAEPAGWADAIALPTAEDLNPDPRILEVAIEAKIGDVEITPGIKTAVWTYNGTTPGPLLRAKVGDTLLVHFTNNLPDETTIHWHGVRVPNAMDGSEATQTPVPPGGTFEYQFTLNDAGTFWYHPHIRSNVQVEKGLYGALIVEDPAEPRFGDEAVLLLDDILLDANGQIMPPEKETPLEAYFGRQGNTLLVNGRVAPKLRVRPGVPMRLRLINAANARYFKLGLAGSRFTRIGGDGGLLTAPLDLDTVMVAPGERADVILAPQGGTGHRLTMQWLPYDRGYGTELASPLDLFSLDLVGLPAGEAPALPTHLRDIAPIDTGSANEQDIKLTEGAVNGDPVLGINGHPFADMIPIEAMVGETQIWKVENTTTAEHPFHLHGFFFQPIDLDGVPAPYREWKDTFSIPTKKTARLAVTFDDRPGMWMFHCHILDHATLGMMGMLSLMKGP